MSKISIPLTKSGRKRDIILFYHKTIQNASLSHSGHRGFTIVELLVVIVIIAILAAISIVSYNTINDKARDAKVKHDLAEIAKAVTIARNNTGKTFYDITGQGQTSYRCLQKDAGTNLANLPAGDSCLVRYDEALDKISEASQIDIRNIRDPWGRPYYIDENEGEGGTYCSPDIIGAFTQPFNKATYRYTQNIPMSGNSGCPL